MKKGVYKHFYSSKYILKYYEKTKGLNTTFFLETNMEIETNVRNINGSWYLRLPQPLVKHLKFEDGDTTIVRDEEGKHGNYFAAWKKPNVQDLLDSEQDVENAEEDETKEEGDEE